MKKSDQTKDDLRPEYDFPSMKGGVRGKYYRRSSKRSFNPARLAAERQYVSQSIT
jgi:hypothetical protein